MSKRIQGLCVDHFAGARGCPCTRRSREDQGIRLGATLLPVEELFLPPPNVYSRAALSERLAICDGNMATCCRSVSASCTAVVLQDISRQGRSRYYNFGRSERYKGFPYIVGLFS